MSSYYNTWITLICSINLLLGTLSIYINGKLVKTLANIGATSKTVNLMAIGNTFVH